jgi:hypothetical protein
MMCRHVIDICFEVRNDYWNTLYLQNAEFLNVKSDGKFGNHWVLKGLLRNLSIRRCVSERISTEASFALV